MVPFYMFSQRELAPAEDQGVVFGDRPGRAELDASIRRSSSRTQVHDVYRSFPEAGSIFQITSPDRRLRRHGDEAVERADEDARQQLARWSRMGPLSKIPGHPRDSADAAAAARAAATSRWTS